MACPNQSLAIPTIKLQRTGNAEPKPSPVFEVAFVHCKREKKADGGEVFNFALVGMMSRMTRGDQWLDSWQCLNDARVRDLSRPCGAGNPSWHGLLSRFTVSRSALAAPGGQIEQCTAWNCDASQPRIIGGRWGSGRSGLTRLEKVGMTLR